MPAALLATALLSLRPAPAEADGLGAAAPHLQLSVAPGVWDPSGSLGPGPGLSLAAAASPNGQLFLGAVVSASRHGADGDALWLGFAGASAGWHLDLTHAVPAVSGALGGLQVRRGAATSVRLAYAVAFSLDWWPRRPQEGFFLGGEVRYLGWFEEGGFPLTTAFALRTGWGF